MGKNIIPRCVKNGGLDWRKNMSIIRTNLICYTKRSYILLIFIIQFYIGYLYDTLICIFNS